jgi:predicted metal-dependent phosphoesterase TrpH
MSDRLGRADLHVHTLASDGTSGVEEILDHVERETDLDVIAITDHERIDAALAARALARVRGLRFEVVVGEEVTTRGGHLLALYVEEPVRPLRPLRWTIAAIHEQGGLAVPSHPLVPYPICAQGPTLRRLLADADAAVRPDGLETFNPTALGRPMHSRAVRFAAEHDVAAIGGSDAHVAGAIGTCWTTFPGRTAEDLRLAIVERRTHAHGAFHGTTGQLSIFGRQLRKYGRDARDGVRGCLRRDGTGRDHGYPGGRLRPPRFDEAALEAARTRGRASDGPDRGTSGDPSR